MLMYLTFSNLNSIHWIIKKDIGLYVLFRTFQVNFQDISGYVIDHVMRTKSRPNHIFGHK